jgi:calmodulin
VVFSEFLLVISKLKHQSADMEDETDLIEAFVACGGQADKSGYIDKDLLVDVIKVS